MSDAAAEGRLYQEAWGAVFNVKEQLRLGSGSRPDRWEAYFTSKVNEILADTWWQFQLAQYANPIAGGYFAEEERNLPRYQKLWDAAFALRKALKNSHRGYRIAFDPEVEGLLRGSGYQLVYRPER